MAMDRNADAESREEGGRVGNAPRVRDPDVSGFNERPDAQGSPGENLFVDTTGVSMGIEGAFVV
jgi:hypothetical protein